MKNHAVSRRYAKALILIGREDGQAEGYNNELSAMVGLLDSQQGFEQALTNPLIGKSERKKLLESVIAAAGFSKVMSAFLSLLFDKGRIGFLRDIAAYYSTMADELKDVVRATVVAATNLSKTNISKIQKSLAKKTGKTVVLDVQKDSSLIGGIITKIGDLVLDGSVKTQLINMRETLKKGESV